VFALFLNAFTLSYWNKKYYYSLAGRGKQNKLDLFAPAFKSNHSMSRKAVRAAYHKNKTVLGIQNGYYINLQHRQDRRLQIESTLRNASIPFHRIDAVNTRLDENKHLIANCFDQKACPGQVGCQLSHLKALHTAMTRNVDHIAIFEDDFVFHSYVDNAMVQHAISETMFRIPHWDVIALSLNILSETVWTNFTIPFSSTFTAGISQIHDAQTTGGYIARKSIIPDLYAAFAECDVKRNYFTAIDQCWKPLQRRYIWIGFEPQPGTQGRSFSDIEQRDVNYELQ
jgi:GR25 family glycosyltransferase involved in LPS biosynthesis